MHPTFYISHSCIITAESVRVDGVLRFSSQEQSFNLFIREAFKNAQIDYPKFYKMDNLSKLAFLAAEMLLHDMPDKQDTALLFANRTGSLDTDVKYQASIQDAVNFYPSPSVFVYTLANICIGEISIRHGLQTENAFFVSDQFDAQTMQQYADYLLISGRAVKVLCGWVEIFEDNYKAVMYIVETSGNLEHNTSNIKDLF